MRHRSLFFLLSFVAAGAGCGNHVGGGSAEIDGGGEERSDASTAPQCVSGDLLVVLDRTGSMSQRPDGSMPPNTSAGALETKWHAAVATIESVTAELEDKLRFGLALFPRDPDGQGGFDCSNLDTWLEEYLPPETNDPACQPAELAVSPQPLAAAAIGDAISTDGTGLCSTTPIGAGLEVARQELARVAEAERDQAVLLITDGDDNCDDNDGYTTYSLPTADALAGAGVALYVLGFDGSGEGIDVAHLNDLACAGGTAESFSANCVQAGGGMRAIDAPSPARLFLSADDQASLRDALDEVAASVCCNCID